MSLQILPFFFIRLVYFIYINICVMIMESMIEIIIFADIQ